MKIKFTIRILILSILTLYIHQDALGQSQPDMKKSRKNLPTFVEIGSLVDIGAFKDKATSPLTYHGIGAGLNIGKLKLDTIYEGGSNFCYIGGLYLGGSGDHYSSSIVNSVFIDHTRLYQIKTPLDEIFNFKIGGEINLTGNIRFNPDLQNNSFGIEYFGNLMVTGQVSTDISRDEEKVLRLWFLKYTLKEKSRNISLRGNFGLINTHIRNGYAYTGQSQVINDFELFDRYQFNAFSGLRLGYKVMYTRYLKTGNAIRWAYQFDGFNTPDGVNFFGMTHNTVSFSLLFRTK